MPPDQTQCTIDEQADQQWMERALALAVLAESEGEVPVGAVVVGDGRILGEGWNAPIASVDPTAHAEICALRAAARQAQNYRLCGATLYVTLEPCAMCIGAMIHARVARLVFGATEPRAGAVISQLSLLNESHFNHQVAWTGGVLAERSSKLLREFFRARRK